MVTLTSSSVYNAIGNFPPVGLMDGSLTDTGSYQGCVNLKTSSGSRANYCLIAFRPLVESRPPFHMISKRLNGLSEVFPGKHMFHDLLDKAQFFNYIYLKTGVCVPQECTASDVQQVANRIANQLALMPGPVKCFSRSLYEHEESGYDVQVIDNQPVQVSIDAPLNQEQSVAIMLVIGFFSVVLFSTAWHAIELGSNNAIRDRGTCSGEYSETCIMNKQIDPKTEQDNRLVDIPVNKRGIGLKNIAFNYFSAISNAKEFFDTSPKENEITCLHGMRVLTMIWIILVHTLQYNEWSGFTRVFEIVNILQNPILHPLYNANYVVDNFFFMSGLLTGYTIWLANKGGCYSLSLTSSIVGRYLRLTPQVFLVSLLYILLPLAGHGPFWYDVTNDASRFCQKNWWINLLHLQAFYKGDEMCNLVSWWISVDMLYYLVAMVLIYMSLNKKHSQALMYTALIVAGCTAISAYRHYFGNFTPNNLGTVPQVGEVWTNYIVNFFWSPFPHAYPFLLGLWIGHALANNKWKQVIREWSSSGAIMATSSLMLVTMSSHIWMSGAVELGDQYISTIYNSLCIFIWATAFAWIIVACHYGCYPLLNQVLSIQPFVIISKASFIIYLSHMLIVRQFFGSSNFVIEVSTTTLSYVIIGNITLSIAFGILLCITFEGPCMKFQKFVTRWIKSTGNSSQCLALNPTEKADQNPEKRTSNPSDQIYKD